MAKKKRLNIPPRKKLRVETIPTSSLYTAIRVGNVSAVEELLNSGSDINGKMKDGFTPLHVAVRNNKLDCFNLLLDRGADVNIYDNRGNLPLHYAVQYGELLIVKRLLNFKSTINAPDGNKNSPLHIGIEHKQFGCVGEILAAGANVDMPDCYGRTPLRIAIDKGYTDVVETLLALKANVQGSYGLRTLNYAILKRNPDCVELLLNAGVDIDLADGIDLSPLYAAASTDSKLIWKKLLDRKPKILTDKSKVFKLFEAVLFKDEMDYVDDLLQAGADVRVKDEKNMTLLHLAASSSRALPLKRLLEFNLDVDVQNNKGSTPLHLACSNRRVKNVVMLLDAGARWDIQNNQKQTMLWDLLHAVMVSRFTDEQLPVLKTILERTNDGLPIDHSTKQTAAHFIMAPLFLEQIDSTFELTKIVVSTQKALGGIDSEGRSVVNHITCNLESLGMDAVALIQTCVERGAHLDSQDCDRIKNNPDVRDLLLQDLQFCIQSIANHFNSCTLFKLYGHLSDALPIEELRITPKWNAWTIIEQDVRLEIKTKGYCDISHFVTTSVSK